MIRLLLFVLLISCGNGVPRYNLEITDCDNYEVELLAKAIAAECSICSLDEQYEVGKTILNRVWHWEFPDDIESVLIQDCQFAPTHHIDLQDFPVCLGVAHDLMSWYIADNSPLYFVAKYSTNTRFVNFVRDGGYTKSYYFHYFK